MPHPTPTRQIVPFAIVLTLLCGTTPGAAQDFTLQVGPPIAAMPQPGTEVVKASKSTQFVVRPMGCADPSAARITATAEGLVHGVHRRVALTLEPLATPGVHAIPLGWAEDGTWVVRLVGSCDGRTAGALVTLGPQDAYRREAVEMIAGAPTASQVDTALSAAARR